jgi:2-dehydro-3-deoxyphosphogluconate aldolase/(4S)-4-hydroxy-2-oxoglutarate aldolase
MITNRGFSPIESITRLGPVIPVLVFNTVEEGVAVSRAIYNGGVKVLEITLRTDVALSVVERVADLADDIIVGVGTITRPEQCAAAKRAGAQFGVAPGLTRALHQAALDAGLPLLPGVMTPSEILQAVELGYHTLKFFPAQSAGGLPMLQALQGPFPNLRFCPTGGITFESAPRFLALQNVVCVGGSWLTPVAHLIARDWPGITNLARAAGALMEAGR